MSPQSRSTSPSQAVAQVLLRKGLATREQLQRAAETARTSRRGLSHAMVSQDIVSEAALLKLLSAIYKVRAVDVSGISNLPAPVLATLDPEVARQNLALPLRRTADTLTVAVPNPANRELLARLGQASGLGIEPVVAVDYALFDAITRFYAARPAAPAVSSADVPHAPAPQAPQPQPPRRAPAAPPPAASPPPPAAPVAAAQVPGAPLTSGQSAHGPGAALDPAADLDQARMQAQAALMMVNLDHMREEKAGGWSGKKLIVVGIIMLIIGSAVTVMSYRSASPGGSFLVTTGLFLGGAGAVVRGLLTLND